MQQQIAVVMGGEGTAAEAARRAGEGVALALESRGHDVLRMQVGPDLEPTLREAGVDAAFLVLEGEMAQDGSIRQRVEQLGIPCIGSGTQAATAAGNHRFTRELLRLHNLPLANGYALEVARSGEALDAHGDLGFPCTVRPVRGAQGAGPMQVASSDALSGAIGWARQFANEVLIERAVAGLRVTVALLDGVVLGLQAGASESVTPKRSRAARLSPARRANLEALARGASRALGCSGPMLVEFSVPAEDNEVITSIDAAPRMVPRGLFATIASQSVASFTQLVERVLEGACLEVPQSQAPRGVVRESFDLAWAS